MRHTLNTIERRFIGGYKTSSASKRYARQVLNVENLPEVKSMRAQEVVIVFSEEDVFDVHPHKGDLMVIAFKCEEWYIKRVLVDHGNSSYILY